MKIKKKIVIFILILSFTSAALIPPKKTNAFAGTAALLLFKAGVSFTAFTSFAHLFYVNGYHMQISDLAVKFANTYYDYANNVYIEKGSKMSQLQKLNLFLAETLSGNRSMTYQDLDEIKQQIRTDFPQYVNYSAIQWDLERFGKIGPLLEYDSTTKTRHIVPEYKDKIVKLKYSSSGTAYVILDFRDYGLNPVPTVEGILNPNMLAIDITGKVQVISGDYYLQLMNWFSDTGIAYLSGGGNRNYNVQLTGSNEAIKDYENRPDTFASNARDFLFSVPSSIYKLLNGRANTVPELENLINADDYLQNEIAKLLEQTQVNKDDPAIIPQVGTDGNLYYPGTQDLPDNPTTPYNPGSAWYNDLIGWVASIPDVINTGLDNFWQNQLNPALDNIGQWVTSIPSAIAEIPAKIAEVTDLTGDIPMEQIQLQNLHLNGVITKFPFSIPFDYVKLLKNFKRDPIAPDLRIKLNTHYFSIDQEIDVASVNKYIVFFRWFSLAIFIYALMMITRKVIKW